MASELSSLKISDKIEILWLKKIGKQRIENNTMLQILGIKY